MHKRHRAAPAQKTRRITRKQLIIRGGLALFGVLMLIQILYPGDRMLPFATVDARSVGLQSKSTVISQLDKAYDDHTLSIYLGTGKKPVSAPKLRAADINVDNTARINAMNYPWYLRLVPTSVLWAGLKQPSIPKPVYGAQFDDYVAKHIMPGCKEDPVNATLKTEGDSLTLVPARNGGLCEQDDVLRQIKTIHPALAAPTNVRVARKETSPTVGDQAARKTMTDLTTRLKSGMTLMVGGEKVSIPAKYLYSWLDFATDTGAVVPSVNVDRAGAWLGKVVAPKVAVAPGVSKIMTVDFTETSRVNGAPGRALDTAATVADMTQVVLAKKSEASATTKDVPPTEQYTRTYSASDTGLTATMTNFAKDHPGTYGASMVELDGKKRRASYNGDKQFVTASTYKLMVAYSLLKQIDAGKRDWDSNSACFNKMISLSDNPCSESFLASLGLSNVTKDVQAIGMKNSTFMKSGGPFTTANDLALELGMIATGQNFSSTNQQRLIGAMKGNVYRKGIPAGVNGTVADKVGFMNGLLHDAAIVYSPNGTYVLAIMTDGSSWESIAELARQLDKLHAQ